MTKNLPHLTKSKYVSGLRCERKLWLDVHDHGPYVDPPLGSVMDIGNRVGKGAHELFPGGIEIEAAPWEHDLAVEETKFLMEDEETPAIFEGAFEYNSIRIRVDVLERLGPKVWGLREVKSSLSVKEEGGHFDDVAVQFYVLRGCGVKVPSVELIHINKQYLRGDPGIVWSELLVRADVLLEAEERSQNIKGAVTNQMAILARSEAPDVYPGKHLCQRPYKCNYWSHCTAGKPDDWINYLPAVRKNQIDKFRKDGIETIRSIPKNTALSKTHQVVREVMQTGKPFISENLCTALLALGPPAYYLDFETVSPIIPIYPGTRPTERIPFQWSVHHLGSGGRLSHFEYLADGDTDPRRKVAEKLLKTLGSDKTPILAYNAVFERSVIQNLADYSKDLAPKLKALVPRVVDLLTIVRSNTYYPGYKGSFSLKSVAPALIPELSYDILSGVAGGLEASSAFWSIAAGVVTDFHKIDGLRGELLEYCRLDTEAMMKVHLELRKLARV